MKTTYDIADECFKATSMHDVSIDDLVAFRKACENDFISRCEYITTIYDDEDRTNPQNVYTLPKE